MSDPDDAADNSKGKPSNDQTGRDEPTETGVAGNQIQPVVDSPNTHREAAKQHRDGYDRANLVILSLTFVAAIAAAIFTGLAWSTFEGQLEEMRKAYGPIKESADAAKKAVELSDKTAERQLRAYLIVDGADIAPLVAGQKIEFHGTIKNTGQTPAYDITGYSAIMYDRFPLPYPFPTAPLDGVKESRAVLGRDQIIHARIATLHAPTQETIDAIKAGKMAVYVFGNATYRDAFGVNRHTNYRFFYTQPSESGGLLGTLGKEGNEAD